MRSIRRRLCAFFVVRGAVSDYCYLLGCLQKALDIILETGSEEVGRRDLARLTFSLVAGLDLWHFHKAATLAASYCHLLFIYTNIAINNERIMTKCILAYADCFNDVFFVFRWVVLSEVPPGRYMVKYDKYWLHFYN